jgi:hypothetical protein
MHFNVRLVEKTTVADGAPVNGFFLTHHPATTIRRVNDTCPTPTATSTATMLFSA